jgi:hypothetical protein
VTGGVVEFAAAQTDIGELVVIQRQQDVEVSAKPPVFSDLCDPALDRSCQDGAPGLVSVQAKGREHPGFESRAVHVRSPMVEIDESQAGRESVGKAGAYQKAFQ